MQINVDEHRKQDASLTFCAVLSRIFKGKPPRNLGVVEGKLVPCPSRPNCVSSQSADAGHYIEPFLFRAEPAAELARLKDLLVASPGIAVVEASECYLRAECSTSLMGFVDDLEFFWNSAERVCHVRSASRMGRFDFGKNRRRVEAIRELFGR